MREEKRRRLLSRQGLMKVKARALRQRVWFQALTRVERSIVDLTIQCVEQVRSRVLAALVSNILTKIQKTLEPRFLELVEHIGRAKAAALGALAVEWGNVEALWWKHDVAYVRFLGVVSIND